MEYKPENPLPGLLGPNILVEKKNKTFQLKMVFLLLKG